ncbi:MAG: MFS transporter [Bacteroidales bacterium]|nr:MFS transporter [Bacteroidales bacterium]
MLWSKNFFLISAANFLMYMAFYMLLPTLPLYLGEHLLAPASVIGTILSLYTVAAMTSRPLAGFWIDRTARKPLMLLFYFSYIAICGSYVAATSILLFFIIRVLHGAAFGSATVGVNTMAVDVIPESRRGEGLGVFTASTSAAMAIGPSVALMMYENGLGFNTIFIAASVIGMAGFICAMLIDAPERRSFSDKPFSLKSLLLAVAVPEAAIMALLSFGYGIVTVYLSVYAKEEVGITSGTGYYFSILAAGLVASRLMSALLLRKGKYIKIFSIGIACVIASFFIVAFIHTPVAFFSSALFMGIGYGLITPTAQTMIVNMAKDTDRGVANATYLTFFDIGVGSGVFVGGVIAQYFNYSTSYALSFFLAICAMAYLHLFIKAHFQKRRLR